MKKILDFILQPFNYLSGKQGAEKISVFISKNKYLVYVISFVITLAIIFFMYIFPNL